MRTASTNRVSRGLTAATLTVAAALAIPAAAGAAPTVTFSAKILPIKGFPHTGNILGAGASLETTFKIEGKEYDKGHPAPLREVDVFFPKGTKINAKAFNGGCTAAALEANGGAGCKKWAAGPAGSSKGVVNIGGEPIEETVSVEPFFSARGLDFWIEGSHPTKIEKVSQGHWTTASAPYGPELVTEVPLIETLTNAPDASAESIHVTAGAAMRKGGKTIYYGTIPTSCPKGGFPGKAILFFGDGERATWQPVTVTTKVPCPKKH